MRPEDLDVALRPRSSWEAMELGTALLRRHAGAVWQPWLLATLPVFALLNAAAWMLDRLWLAMVLMWWLKPLFERIPLYVLSRGVFGRTPPAWETLRAQVAFGRGAMPGYLLWRRLSPARSLLLPVDVLEGTAGTQRWMRRRVVGGPAYAQAALLTWTCWLFELALALGAVAAVFVAVPAELLPASLRSFWALLYGGPPPWLLLGFNLAFWLAMSVIGPFYTAAGFGLYLNRRTETEAWDVELAFRRLRERLLAQAAAPLAVALLACTLLLPWSAYAQEPGDDAEPATLEQVFGPRLADDAGFREAAARAYRDPPLGGERTLVEWKPKAKERPQRRPGPDLSALAALLSLLAEWGLWILAGVLLLAVVLTAPRWLPWLRGSLRRRRTVPTPVATVVLAEPEPLPDDIASVARRLWQDGRQRDALALLYRGSVEAMSLQAGVELPPGATEAQCLRAARRLPLDAARELFAGVVRVWQYAAYAGRLPEQDEFESLLDAARVQWGWSR
ncbi:DUF4129 domain-containing protein [Pseudoxanthomonas suwonensis]|uniref:Uncharacterized protein n=1 Tax=Pseudoxanthomonas suwonensis TaxID=314722 RepID=A0A0E3Z164_9GAMM|nr:DUF4129 domain-containing protein [Pseudoxanthomonas suwonensis]AKC86898.1 hypothetical protein WQ53_09165 [Pseudoxanthomonas suwonensis]